MQQNQLINHQINSTMKIGQIYHMAKQKVNEHNWIEFGIQHDDNRYRNNNKF